MMANDYFEWKIKCKNSCYVPSTMEVRKTKAWPKFTEKSEKYSRQCDEGNNICRTSDRPIRYPAHKSSSPQADRPDGKTLQTPHSFTLTMKTNAIYKECICKSFINNLPPSAKTLTNTFLIYIRNVFVRVLALGGRLFMKLLQIHSLYIAFVFMVKVNECGVWSVLPSGRSACGELLLCAGYLIGLSLVLQILLPSSHWREYFSDFSVNFGQALVFLTSMVLGT